MPSIFEKQKLTLKCGGCGRDISETLARLKTNPKLTCIGCGAVTEVSADDLARALKSAEKSVEGLRKAIRDFGRK